MSNKLKKELYVKGNQMERIQASQGGRPPSFKNADYVLQGLPEEIMLKYSIFYIGLSLAKTEPFNPFSIECSSLRLRTYIPIYR